MQNVRAVAGLRRKAVSLFRMPKGGEASLVARTVALSTTILVAAAFLVVRELPFRAISAWSTLEHGRVWLSALPGCVAILILLFLLQRGHRILHKFAGSNPLALGVAIMAWATALACLDLLAGKDYALFLSGAVLAGLLFWNRPGFLALLMLSAGAVFLSFASFISAAGTGIPVGTGLSWGMAAMSALLVRRSTAPSQERLRSLEAENKELWNLSFRDGLTGLYNRRFATETGATMFTRAQRYHEELHVLMIDIDHFKKVNDKLGHPVGDIVLKDVAEIIRANVRSSDMAARYGGEEFILFIVRAEPELVQFIANRIRDGIAAHGFENVPWQVTVSIGVASIQQNDSLEELIDRSDKFLYLSKHSGRNRVSGS